MDNILSTLKGEYSRTLILILIPGAIAFEPFAVMLYKYQSLNIRNLKDYIPLVSIIYLLASFFVGFIIQDVASRIEIYLDKKFCKENHISAEAFYKQFNVYLFNRREEDFIITHYYRTILIRMRFELHSCASILMLLTGSILRVFVEVDFRINWTKSFWFTFIAAAVFIYLLYEAKQGVELLHKLRLKINDKFKPFN